MICEKIIFNEERNVSLTCYLQEGNLNRPAVIVLPGGGYMYCSDREADPVAQAYLQAGYHAFVLRYSVKEHSLWPNPLNDFDEAMDYIRSNSEQWYIYENKIAVIGFSAGGHLAAAAATMSKNRPNAAIIGYGVVGSDVKACNYSAPNTIEAIDEKTCPCFLFSTRNDALVPVMNTIQFMEGLCQFDISFESHIYAYGPHGFSTNISSVQDRDTLICNRAKNWVNDSIEWLKDIFGDFKNNSLTEPRCNHYINADHEEVLSLDCTLGHLFQYEEAKQLIEPHLSHAVASEEMLEYAKNMTLRGVLGFARVSSEVMTLINEQLSQIKK